MDTNWKGEKRILNGKGKRDTKRKGKKGYYTERENRTKEQTTTKRKGKKTNQKLTNQTKRQYI